MIGIELRQWFQFEMNVFSTIKSFQGWDLLDQFIIFHFKEINCIQLLLVVLFEPLIKLLFRLSFLLLELLLFVINLEILNLLGKFSIMNNPFNFFSESNQIFYSYILSRQNCIKFVVKIFVGFMLTLFYFF